MNRSKSWVFFILFVVFIRIGQAKAPPFSPPPDLPAVKELREKIQSILPLRKLKHLEASIMVVSIDKKEALYALNEEKLLIPASVSKVVTSYAVLKKLGPTSSFNTQVYMDGKIKDGTLTGNLYLKGGGDPSLVSERLWMLVNELQRWGITKIMGDIVGDSSYYDTERVPASRPTYLTDEAYNAPVGALSFNFNTTTIFVRPGEEAGKKPQVYIDPENSYIDVVNQATTGKKGSKFSLSASRLKEIEGDIGDTVLIRGAIPEDHEEKRYYRNIVNPTLYSVHMFKKFVERRGVQILGRIKEGKVPSNGKLLVDFPSLPMWQIVWGLNKFSNNFVADQLLKKLGASRWGVPGSLNKGLTAIQEALEDIGIPKASYQIADGSGLNRKTRVSAQIIVSVLNAASRDFTISPEYGTSLGIAGADGTLRSRLRGPATKDRLRGKTGTLDGASALAGFVPSQDGELLAFAILLNDPKRKYGTMTGWVDKIAYEIGKFSRK